MDSANTRKGGIHAIWLPVVLLAGFVGGVYVGLHPDWVPFSVPGGRNVVVPTDSQTPAFHPRDSHSTTQPVTQPADAAK